MSAEKIARYVLVTNALINWTLSLPGILDPEGIAVRFGGPLPNYPFVIRLWSSLVFMFGLMFWETSRDVRGKRALFKYNWIEKSITACCVTLGYWSGDVPPRLMALIVLTNWLWIPLLVFLDIRIGRLACAREGSGANESSRLGAASR